MKVTHKRTVIVGLEGREAESIISILSLVLALELPDPLTSDERNTCEKLFCHLDPDFDS